MPQFQRRAREFLRFGIECNLAPSVGIARAPLEQGFRNLRSPGIVQLTWPVIAQSRVAVESFGLVSRNFVVTGVTKDSTGAALASMRVYLFRFGQDMVLLSQGVSDGSGNYSLPAPDNAGPFFVVSLHPDGSLAGVTRPVLTAQAV